MVKRYIFQLHHLISVLHACTFHINFILMGKGFDDDKSFDRAIIWDYKRKIACLVKRSVICNIELVNGSMGGSSICVIGSTNLLDSQKSF